MPDEMVFLAPLPAFRKRTRLAKMVTLLRGRGVPVSLYGWERVPGEVELLRWADPGVREIPILRGGGYASRQARAMYPLWMWVVFWKVAFLKSNTVVFCLGWESAFPAVLAAVFSRAIVVFDDADRFSLLLNLPGPARSLIQKLERWTSRAAFLHIVPGVTRYDWWHDKMRVLRNTPSSEDFAKASSKAQERDNCDLVLYVNGWISWDTGSPTYLKVLDGLAQRGLRVVMHVAGRVVSDEGLELLRHDSVQFHGELPQVEALALYAKCDLVLTFYDPAVEINKHAESNKWGDCVYFGVPFIVNSEVTTARRFVDAGAAWQAPYHDASGLVELLHSFVGNPQKLADARECLKSLRGDFRPYDETFGEIVDMLKVT